MPIECNHTECVLHGCHWGGEGPFCDEDECYGVVEQRHVRELTRSVVDQGIPEICVCAAVLDGQGRIWRGHRHNDCYSTAKRLEGMMFGRTPWKEGFITTHNRFVDRREGYRLQVAAGIESASPPYRGGMLYSEDLY